MIKIDIYIYNTRVIIIGLLFNYMSWQPFILICDRPITLIKVQERNYNVQYLSPMAITYIIFRSITFYLVILVQRTGEFIYWNM